MGEPLHKKTNREKLAFDRRLTLGDFVLNGSQFHTLPKVDIEFRKLLFGNVPLTRDGTDDEGDLEKHLEKKDDGKQGVGNISRD